MFSKLLARKRAALLDKAALVAEQGDFAGAATILRRGAEADDPEAQYRLCELYERGRGVAPNYVEATRWFATAAEHGHVLAAARLGEIYLTGRVPPTSVTAAAATHLAEMGDRDSPLKKLFPQGFAIRQNPEEAARWNRFAS